MSLNWVMLGSDGFVHLPKEIRLWASPPRTAIQIQSMNTFPGREPFNISSSSGRVYLTNQRIVYLPEPSSQSFQSFATPLLGVHDSRITTPLFGPNTWIALVQPVSGGGIASHHSAVEMKMTFKDGGAYDFHTKFVQLKERLQQAAAVAAESGQLSQEQAGRVNMDAVHLEQLPAYEESSPSSIPVPQPSQRPTAPSQPAPSRTQAPPPDEPPPGYEEAQSASNTR